MLICLDYDNTYTLDPTFWDGFIVVSKARGHSVILATMRYETEGAEVREALETKVDNIIFTNRKGKRAYLKALNILPDVWIDDMPEFVVYDAVTTV
jgi:hypothetical protein